MIAALFFLRYLSEDLNIQAVDDRLAEIIKMPDMLGKTSVNVRSAQVPFKFPDHGDELGIIQHLQREFYFMACLKKDLWFVSLHGCINRLLQLLNITDDLRSKLSFEVRIAIGVLIEIHVKRPE